MKEETYDVTILVRGKGGTVKVELGKIPRASIFAPDYPESIRAVVKLYESSFGAEEPECELSPDGLSIRCLTCGHTSHNPHDVEQLYCGYCHKFHGQARS